MADETATDETMIRSSDFPADFPRGTASESLVSFKQADSTHILCSQLPIRRFTNGFSIRPEAQTDLRRSRWYIQETSDCMATVLVWQ
jgi:hypothetical protein